MKGIIPIFAILFLLISLVAYSQVTRVQTTSSVAMTAPGYSTAVFTGQRYNKVMWYFKIASINTSVAVALQSKLGSGEWTNVWADSLVYTKNGNYGLEWFGAALADSIRFRWLYEVGGTAATVTHNAILVGGD